MVLREIGKHSQLNARACQSLFCNANRTGFDCTKRNTVIHKLFKLRLHQYGIGRCHACGHQIGWLANTQGADNSTSGC